MEKEKHHIPEDNILNEHVASITEAIASAKPLMEEQLKSIIKLNFLQI